MGKANLLQSISFLTLLCLFCGGIFSFIGFGLACFVFDIPLDEISQVFSALDQAENIAIVKFLQLFNSIGIFIIPGILYGLIYHRKELDFLKIKSLGPALNYLFVLILFLLFMPFLNWTMALNAEMHLPEFMQGIESWMRTSENQAERLTEAFLVMNTPLELVYNILLIGILPALGEELIFRGLLQQTISRSTQNAHLGIWVSAALFSAIHVQFFGFLPRLLLGAFFGYLLLYSRSLWLPIFGHFVNNTSALLLVYFMGRDRVEEEVDSLGSSSDGSLWLPLLSLALFLALFYQFKKAQKKPPAIE